MLMRLGGSRHITMPNIIKIYSLSKAEILRFLDFPNGRCCFSLTGFRWSRLMSMSNFGKIGQSVAKILRFFNFSKWRAPSSWIFKFVQFHWQTVSGRPRLIIVLNVVKIGRFFSGKLIDIAAHLGDQIAQNPNFWGVNRHFPAKRAKYWNAHIIKKLLHRSILTKFCRVIETPKYSPWVVQIGRHLEKS